MPRELTLRGPVYSFQVFDPLEARQLGLIDSYQNKGTHAPVSTTFEHGEGKLLAEFIEKVPDAVLIATGRYQITVYRPKRSVRAVLPESETADQ